MEPGEASVARKHLFYEDARVTGSKHMHQAGIGNGLGEYFGSPLDGFQLSGLNAFQDRLGFLKIG
jgi:hypothetical protein